MPIITIKNFSFAIYLLFVVMAYLSLSIPQMLFHSLFMIWLVLAVLSGRVDRLKGMVSLLCFLFFILICSIQWGVTTAFGRVIAFMEVCSPIVAFSMYKGEKEKVGITIWTLLAILLINAGLAFNNISSFMQSGLRQTLSSDASYDQEVFKNGFSMAYSLSIIIPLLVYSLLHHKRWRFLGWKHKLWIVAIALFIILFSLFVYFSMFMTALIVMILGVLLAFVVDKKHWAVKSFLVIVISLVLFMTFYESIYSILQSGSAASSFFSDRMGEVYATLSGNAKQADDMNSRMGLMSLSLGTFFQNPIIGIYYKLSSFDVYKAAGIGNHSEWIDMLGLYGLFSLLLFHFIYCGIVCQKKHCRVLVHVYLFLLIGFLNPVFTTFTTISVFMFSPYFLFYMFGDNRDSKSY